MPFPTFLRSSSHKAAANERRASTNSQKEIKEVPRHSVRELSARAFATWESPAYSRNGSTGEAHGGHFESARAARRASKDSENIVMRT